jgi:hypothetical protein
MYPSFKTQPSPDGRVYPAVVHDAKAMIEPLLYSPLMDDTDNLLFPNPENPLEGPPPYARYIIIMFWGKTMGGCMKDPFQMVQVWRSNCLWFNLKVGVYIIQDGLRLL